MKVFGQIKRGTMLLVLLLLLASLSVACSNSESQEIPKETAVNTEASKAATEVAVETTAETEPEAAMQGKYTLEECTSKRGVFIAYEDGSFDLFPVGGYCYGYSRFSEGLDGFYIANSVAEAIPDVGRDDKLVVFCDDNYYLTLYPVHGEISTIRTESENGVTGYGRLSNTLDCVYVHYEDGESETIRIEYINGEPADVYDAVKLNYEVKPYKGKNSVAVSVELTGFQKGEPIRLGIVDGTAVSEYDYSADATYFDCNNEHNNWDEEDAYGINYGVQVTPTFDGYATIDFSEVPDGKYVVIFRYIKGEKQYYQSTLLNLQST